MYGVPPYGYNYLSPAPPLFETPFITAADGTNNGQPFPHTSRAARCLAEQARSPHRLVAVPARSTAIRTSATTTRRPYTRELHVLDRAAAGAELVMTAELCRQPGHNMLVVQATQPRRSGALSERQPGESGGAGQRDVRTVRRKRRVHQGRRHGHQRHAHRLAPNYGTITKQRRIGYSRYNGVESDLRYTRAGTAILAGYTLSKSMDVSSFSASRSTRSMSRCLKRHRRSTCVTTSSPATTTSCRSSSGSSESNQLDIGLGAVGHDAAEQRLPGDALQPDGYVAARHVRQRRQQQPARHAGLHAGLRSEDQPRSRRKAPAFNTAVSACLPLDSSATRRDDSSTVRASRTSTSRCIKHVTLRRSRQNLEVPARSVQRLQPSAVLRRRGRGRQRRQPDVRRNRNRRGAALRSAGRQVHVLRLPRMTRRTWASEHPTETSWSSAAGPSGIRATCCRSRRPTA